MLVHLVSWLSGFFVYVVCGVGVLFMLHFTESFDLFYFVFVVFLFSGVISEILFMCVDSIAS